VIAFVLIFVAAFAVGGCASDATAAAIRGNEQAIADAQRDLQVAERLAASAVDPQSRAAWEAEAESLRREIEQRREARDGLVREHDAADANDAQAWSDTWATGGGIAAAAGIPGAAAIAGIIGNLRGRRSGASILATAIARARKIDHKVDDVFRDDSSPGIALLKGATPESIAAIIRAVNEEVGVNRPASPGKAVV
jgi:hypothetical protein